jgi:hypothetical protein
MRLDSEHSDQLDLGIVGVVARCTSLQRLSLSQSQSLEASVVVDRYSIPAKTFAWLAHRTLNSISR